MIEGFSTYAEWLASRPPLVRQTLQRFPPMTLVVIDDRTHFVIGASEDGDLLISPINPHDDYEGALDAVVTICAADLKGLRVHAIGVPDPREPVRTQQVEVPVKKPALPSDTKALCDLNEQEVHDWFFGERHDPRP